MKELRQPPQAFEAEEALLSAAMLGAAGEVLSLIEPDDFYRTQHRLIMQSIADLHSTGLTVELPAVVDRLRAIGKLDSIGGVSTVSRLVDNIPAAGSVEWAASRILEAAARRRMIQWANSVAQAAYDEPDFAQVQAQIHQLKDLDQPRTASSCFTSYAQLAETEIERWERINQDITGVPSGFGKIDNITGGFQPSDLIVVAARPGMGKTVMALNVAENAARQGYPVAIFSLEMSRSQLYARQTARVARVDSQRFRVGGIQSAEWKHIVDAQEQLHGLPVFIDDTSRQHVNEIARRARYAADKMGVKIVIIDYLQLLRGDSRQTRKDLEIGAITAELKGLAKELDIPVLLLSQLNRMVESREDKRPRLSDLRESGAIEQDSDIVIFLYRDEYYNPATDQKGLAELCFAKHRNGPTGTIKLQWVAFRQSFENI